MIDDLQYPVTLPGKQPGDLVDAFRKAYPETTKLWHDLFIGDAMRTWPPGFLPGDGSIAAIREDHERQRKSIVPPNPYSFAQIEALLRALDALTPKPKPPLPDPFAHTFPMRIAPTPELYDWRSTYRESDLLNDGTYIHLFRIFRLHGMRFSCGCFQLIGFDSV